MKTRNKLQELYNEKGYSISCNNRSYFAKSINKALENPNVRLILIEKGYVKKQSNGFRYNLAITINGKGKSFRLKDFSPEAIAKAFASVTKMPHVKEMIHIHEDAHACSKCSGKGIIPAFMHVCDGVCFDCLGIGYRFLGEH